MVLCYSKTSFQFTQIIEYETGICKWLQIGETWQRQEEIVTCLHERNKRNYTKSLEISFWNTSETRIVASNFPTMCHRMCARWNILHLFNDELNIFKVSIFLLTFLSVNPNFKVQAVSLLQIFCLLYQQFLPYAKSSDVILKFGFKTILNNL